MAKWRGKGPDESPHRDYFQQLCDQTMQDPPRRVRDKEADYLLGHVIDDLVAELRPICEAYAARLGYFNQILGTSQFNHSCMEELSEVAESGRRPSAADS